MIEDTSNIRNKVEMIPKNTQFKKFYRKNLKIKHIAKDQFLSSEKNTIINEHKNFKTIFIKKKRGRISKSLNEDPSASKHNRFSDDNIKRKIKTHFHNFMIALLNSQLAIKNPNDKIIKFGKMKSDITQNITIEYNKILLNKLIKEIIIEVSNRYQNKNINADCINYIMKNDKENISIIQLLNMKYKDMYQNYYLNSTKKNSPKGVENESFEAHKEKLKKFGEKYLQNYIKNAEGLIEFYNKCSKRKSRKKIESSINENNDLNNVEISIVKDNNKEFNNSYFFNKEIQYIYDDNNGIYKDKIMISEFTQTNFKRIGDESDNEY